MKKFFLISTLLIMSTFKALAQYKPYVPEYVPIRMYVEQISRTIQESDRRYKERLENEKQTEETIRRAKEEEEWNRKQEKIKDATMSLNAAINSINDNEYGKADFFIDQSLKVYELPESHFIKAWLLITHYKNPNSAISSLEICLRKNFNVHATQLLLGACYMAKEDYDRALSYYMPAAKYVSNNPSAYEGIGICYAKTGNHGAALQNLTKAASFKGIVNYDYSTIDSYLADEYYYRGMEQYKMGMKQQAYSDLKKASELGNKNATKSLRTLKNKQTTKKVSTTKKRVQSKSRR